jgi:hypothetical protein
MSLGYMIHARNASGEAACGHRVPWCALSNFESLVSCGSCRRILAGRERRQATETNTAVAAMVKALGGTVSHMNDAAHPPMPWDAK